MDIGLKEIEYIANLSRIALTGEEKKIFKKQLANVLDYIKKSPEFTKFIELENNEISFAELKSFLGGTLETPKRILRHNLNRYFQAATIYNDTSVISFLNLCKKKLTQIGG